MIQRNIEDELRDALADSPVVYIRGARQTGKSTLVRAVSDGEFSARYVTLDNATSLAAAKSDSAGFLEGMPVPLILDEVQRVPELLLAVKEKVDRDRRSGMYLLTGSANLLTMPLVSDSLAGRMDVLTLWPFSQGELCARRERFVDVLFQEEPGARLRSEGACDIADLLVTGGYPEAVRRKSPKRRGAWFESYLTSIIERDIRDIARIQETADMLRLLRLLAVRTGTILNQSELSRTARIPNATLGRYLALLSNVFLAHLLPAWSPNLGKRLVKSPKVFMVDCGLAAQLIGADSARLEREPELTGQLLETFVVNEVVKQLTWSSVRARPYHFRTHAGLEVDLILETSAGDVAGIEVKKSAQVSSKHFRGLRSLRDDLGEKFRAGVVLYLGREIVPFGEKLFAVPVDALWAEHA